jgi:hypothetical protein
MKFHPFISPNLHISFLAIKYRISFSLGSTIKIKSRFSSLFSLVVPQRFLVCY